MQTAKITAIKIVISVLFYKPDQIIVMRFIILFRIKGTKVKAAAIVRVFWKYRDCYAFLFVIVVVYHARPIQSFFSLNSLQSR